MRIAYFGLPLGAVVLARAGFAPVVTSLGHPDGIGARRLRRAPSRTLLLGKPSLEDGEIVRLIASARPDVVLSWFWPRRIPQRVLSLAPRGAFGVHPSLLPRHRGGDPYFHAILAGDAETGVTLHRLDADYDTGAIVDAIPLAIREGENAWQLARRLDRPSLALLVRCATRLARGEALDGTPQDEARATAAEPPTEDELAIDWHASTEHVTRLVRAASPHPGATALLGEALVSIVEASAREDAPAALEPGEAFFASGRVRVKTSDGAVELDVVRIEDSEREPAGAILRGEAIARLIPSGEG
jgi:methionyl-tRNA formyltransferase